MQMILCVFVFVVSTTVANAVLYNGFLAQRSGLSNKKSESEDSTLYYDPKSPELIDEAASFVQLGSSKKETTDHTWYYDPKDPPMPIAEAPSFIQVGSAMYDPVTLRRMSLKIEDSKAERKWREMSEDSKKEIERKSLARALTARKKYDEAMSSLQVSKMQKSSPDEVLAEFLQATDKYQQSVQDAPTVPGEDAANKEAATMNNEALQKEVASLKVDLAQMQLDKVTKMLEQPNAAKMSLIDSSKMQLDKVTKMLEEPNAPKMLLIESTKVEKAMLALDDLKKDVASPKVDQRKASSALSLIQSSKVEKAKLALDELQNAAESEATRANAWSDHLAQWMTQDASTQVEEAKLALYLKSAAESEAEKERKNAWRHHLSNWMTQGATSKASKDWSHHLSNWMTQGATNKASKEGKATIQATNEATNWIMSQGATNQATNEATNQASKEDNADWRHGDEDQWHGMMSRMMGRMVKSDDPSSFVQVSSEHEDTSAAANVDMFAKAQIVEALYGVDKYSETPGMPTSHDRIRVTANGHMNNGFVDL